MKRAVWLGACVLALSGCGAEAVGTAATATGASAAALEQGRENGQRVQQDLNHALQAVQQQRREALDAAER